MVVNSWIDSMPELQQVQGATSRITLRSSAAQLKEAYFLAAAVACPRLVATQCVRQCMEGKDKLFQFQQQPPDRIWWKPSVCQQCLCKGQSGIGSLSMQWVVHHAIHTVVVNLQYRRASHITPYTMLARASLANNACAKGRGWPGGLSMQ